MFDRLKKDIPCFNRDLFGATEKFTRIGDGEIGGKACGLAFIKDSLISELDFNEFLNITVNVPALTVIATDVFDAFMKRNNLYDVAYSDISDERIAHVFQKASLPGAIVGDLWGLIGKIHTPLAIRSSSLLEDALHHPFAGVYDTKMIPNNQPDAESRFRRLDEAIKFVFASTFFKAAKDYMKVIGRDIKDEKMAVIIQEVVGSRFGDRYYPHVSGVARSYNYYPFGHAGPEDGVIDLALGLGKTIVDGGKSWPYSPVYPEINPPYGSVRETMKQTQSEFWAVNMGKPPAYDPIKETEYLLKSGLKEAEYDGTLRFIASTYQPHNDRIVIGTGTPGPRVLNFAPLIRLGEISFNEFIKKILDICKKKMECDVEIEFALTIGKDPGKAIRFGFLQVRPMVVSKKEIEFTKDEMTAGNVLVASERVMGNDYIDYIEDIIYVKPGYFDAKHTSQIAGEIDRINQLMVASGRHYLLIGFGRWGSSDPWLGIPVNWGQISKAKVIVEATRPDMNVELSQGAHFFHNITSFKICYMSVPYHGVYKIDWDWLESIPSEKETEFVRHIRVPSALKIKIDGKNRCGVIRHE